MANPEYLEILRQGVEVWNRWREENPDIRPDLRDTKLEQAKLECANLAKTNLSRAELSMADLEGANLSGAVLKEARLLRVNARNANLSEATLFRAIIFKANLTKANLSGAELRGADISWADLCGANLSNADCGGANFSNANLSGADFSGADLTQSILVGTNFEKATLTDCRVFGISAWELKLKETKQSDLIISRVGEPLITVDNLEVAQFIYLLLHNQKIRQVIDTITSKVVLILGRFSPERKEILDALRAELRKRNYSPILFDFEQPASRDLTETISILAHLARFIIADISEAKSISQELQRIIPDLPSVPVQPLIVRSDYEYALFEHFRRYPWVLDVYQYDRVDDLLSSLEANVITPAEEKAKELTKR